MNVTSVITKEYEDERLSRRGENKPNQTQSPRPRFYPKNQHAPENQPQKIPFPLNQDIFSLIYNMRYAIA